MARIIIEADDSTREVVFWERVGADDFSAEHFRRCLCDRIAWAVADAEEVQRRPLELVVAEEEPNSGRFLREADPDRDPDPDLVYA
jgi:hypothetical protein